MSVVQRAGGWKLLSHWRSEKRREDGHLDFKQGGFANNGHLQRDDHKNLARSLSAFGNTEGGVLVFGPEARNEVLTAVRHVEAPLDAYANALDARIRDATTPAIRGVDVRPLEDQEHPNRGLVAVYVPFTDGPPYRAEGPDPVVSKRYFMRVGSAADVKAPGWR